MIARLKLYFDPPSPHQLIKRFQSWTKRSGSAHDSLSISSKIYAQCTKMYKVFIQSTLLIIIIYFSTKTHVVGTQKTRSALAEGYSIRHKIESHWFKTHPRHWVVALSKKLYPLFKIGSTKEDKKKSRHD